MTSLLVCLHCTYNLYIFVLQLYRMYSLCYLVLRYRFGFVCGHSTIVSYVLFILSCTMFQFGFVCSLFGLFCCSDTNTPFPCSTDSIGAIHCFPPPLKSQWWSSCSGRPPSTINTPIVPCPHWFNPTDQACQSCSYKPFLNNTPSAVIQ